MNYNGIHTDLKLYYVSVLELKDFYNKFKDLSYFYSVSSDNLANVFKFKIEHQNEIITYWKNKGLIDGFKNLTLIFTT